MGRADIHGLQFAWFVDDPADKWFGDGARLGVFRVGIWPRRLRPGLKPSPAVVAVMPEVGGRFLLTTEIAAFERAGLLDEVAAGHPHDDAFTTAILTGRLVVFDLDRADARAAVATQPLSWSYLRRQPGVRRRWSLEEPAHDAVLSVADAEELARWRALRLHEACDGCAACAGVS